jgi:hypothetical protein
MADFFRKYGEGPPYAQGYWAGDCGIYAILNSCCYLLDYDDSRGAEQLHKFLMENVNIKNVMSEGLNWNELGKLAFKTVEHLDNVLTVRREFIHTKVPKNTFEYLNLLGKHIGTGIALIGLNKPEPHWSNVTKVENDFVHFYDSTYLPDKVSYDLITAPKDDFTGEYVICPHQILVFRRRGEIGPEVKEKGRIRYFLGENPKLKRYR